jgi:hypothetical protein
VSASLATAVFEADAPPAASVDAWRPLATHLPAWGNTDLPEPTALQWSHWRSVLGPGIVMMGVQIGAGEWHFGPEITFRNGDALMWLATIAIVLQVFHNLEVGRYALYCGEPIFTAFLPTKPRPQFWVPYFVLLSLDIMLPGLAFHSESVLTTLWLGATPADNSRALVVGIAFGWAVLAFLPALFGRKIYNMLQAIMTVKVVGVLAFCIVVSLLLVDAVCRRWADIHWSAGPKTRAGMHGGEVKHTYYALAACCFVWRLSTLCLFGTYGTPRLVTPIIGNLGNPSMGITAFHTLWGNCRWLPPAIRPGWAVRCGLAACGVFFLAAAGLVLPQSAIGKV